MSCKVFALPSYLNVKINAFRGTSPDLILFFRRQLPLTIEPGLTMVIFVLQKKM